MGSTMDESRPDQRGRENRYRIQTSTMRLAPICEPIIIIIIIYRNSPSRCSVIFESGRNGRYSRLLELSSGLFKRRPKVLEVSPETNFDYSQRAEFFFSASPQRGWRIIQFPRQPLPSHSRHHLSMDFPRCLFHHISLNTSNMRQRLNIFREMSSRITKQRNQPSPLLLPSFMTVLPAHRYPRIHTGQEHGHI